MTHMKTIVQSFWDFGWHWNCSFHNIKSVAFNGNTNDLFQILWLKGFVKHSIYQSFQTTVWSSFSFHFITEIYFCIRIFFMIPQKLGQVLPVLINAMIDDHLNKFWSFRNIKHVTSFECKVEWIFKWSQIEINFWSDQSGQVTSLEVFVLVEDFDLF